MPLQFTYFESCHYNSSLLRTVPFYTSLMLLDPLADPCIFVWSKIPLLLLSLPSLTCGAHTSASPSTSPPPCCCPRARERGGDGDETPPPSGFTAPGRMPPPRPSSAAGAGRPSRTAKPRRRSSLESSAPASATPARASAALEPARLRLALAAAVGLAMASAAGLRRGMAAVAGLRPAIASARRASASPWPPRRQSRAETRRLCSGSPECTAAVLAPAPPSPSRAEQRREAPRRPPPPPRPGSIEGGRVDGRRRSGLGAVRRGSRAEGRPRGAGAILPLVTSASSSPESS